MNIIGTTVLEKVALGLLLGTMLGYVIVFALGVAWLFCKFIVWVWESIF